MNWKKVWPYWGLVVLVLAVAGWLTSDVGPPGLAVLFALSFVWFLVQAPLPCGAPKRKQGEYCRRNAKGLLRGCHLEQHKWQRLRTLLIHRRLRRTARDLFPDSRTGLASLGALVALVCTLTTTTLAVLGKGGSS